MHFFFFCRLSAYIWRLRADPVHHVLFSFPYLFFFFFRRTQPLWLSDFSFFELSNMAFL